MSACTCGKTTAAPCYCTDPWPVATGKSLRGFVQRRRSLRDEYQRILRVQMEAKYLMEELRRRRDGEQPSYIDLEYLRQAVEEVRDVRV